MKQVLIGLLLLIGVGYAQPEVKTQPKATRQMQRIYHDKNEQKLLITSDTTSFVAIRDFRGALAAFFDVDTVGCGAPSADSLAIIPLYKKAGSQTVYGPYTTVKDTVSRTKINSATEINFVHPLPDLTSYGWADSLGLGLFIRTGDSINVKIEIGGQ